MNDWAGTTVFRLSKPQAKIFNSPKRFVVVNAGRRFGKSWVAGAKAFEVASLPIKEGFGSITRLNNEIKAWMERHNFDSISDFCGRLAQEESEDGYKWERTQFLKIISRD